MSDAKFVCECRKDFRSACEGLGFYREVEGKNYCVLHCPTKDKVNDFNVVLHRKLSSFEYDFRGAYFPAEISFQGMNFVSDAVFRSATFSASVSFTAATFSAQANFSWATFSGEASFAVATFSANAGFNSATFGDSVDFGNATFSGAANFSSAMFSTSAFFSYATFSTTVYFNSAMFSAKADFSSVTFSAKADFSEATFSAKADFGESTFSAATFFRSAKIESYLRFTGSAKKPVFAEPASLNLELAQIAEPEQLIFHTVDLWPHWFVNVDSRKFEFTNVNWVGFDPAKLTWRERAKQKLKRALTAGTEAIKHGIGSEALHNELQAMSNQENHHRLLSITFRQLATNAEDNNRYGDAARFRYASMDARRLEQWRGWNIFTLDWWYWLVSGYGERIPRASFALLLILLLFSVPYRFVGFAPTKFLDQDKCGAPIRASAKYESKARQFIADTATAAVYSLETASLQKPEPRPTTFWARFFVGLETILAPLQAALLALAIRRRFMR